MRVHVFDPVILLLLVVHPFLINRRATNQWGGEASSNTLIDITLGCLK